MLFFDEKYWYQKNSRRVSRDLYIFWIFSYGISVESFIIVGYVRLQILDLLKLKWFWWIEQTAYINFYKQTAFSLTLHYSCFSPVYSFSKTKTKKQQKKTTKKQKKQIIKKYLCLTVSLHGVNKEEMNKLN